MLLLSLDIDCIVVDTAVVAADGGSTVVGNKHDIRRTVRNITL